MDWERNFLILVPEEKPEGVNTVFALLKSAHRDQWLHFLLQQVTGTQDLLLVHLVRAKRGATGQVGADVWHRRMGHINGKRLEPLN